MRAGFSAARGSGKTGLASALALDSIRPAGALHVDAGETIVVASSFQQARLTFEAVRTSLELMGEIDAYRILDQQNMGMVQHRESKARLRVAGSDNRRAHGWRFNFCLCDEPAQWGPRGESLAAAIRTALGKRRDARALFFGTRPANDAHFFARMLKESDPAVFSQVHAATADDRPMLRSTWHKANPGLKRGLPMLSVLEAEARLAKRDPAELATFRSLRLNQGTPDVQTAYLIDPETWRQVETDELPPRVGPVSFGLDLGSTAAFSACAAWWPKTGRLEGFVACGNQPALSERALADGVSGVYETMRDAGELVQMGGRIVPVGAFLREAVQRFGKPQAIACDRFRAGELQDGVKEAGLSLPEPSFRGQGWRDGGQDIRLFRAAVLDGKVAAPVSIAMRAALAESKTVTDSAANEKLAKSGEGSHRRRGRDDLAAAIVVGVAEGCRREGSTIQRRWRYRGGG